MKKQITTLEAYRYLLEKIGNRVIDKEGDYISFSTEGDLWWCDDNSESGICAAPLHAYTPLYIEVEDEPMESNYDVSARIFRSDKNLAEEILDTVDIKLKPLLERIKVLEAGADKEKV